MASPFDILRDSVFQAAEKVFGYEASWESIDGEASYSGTVLFKNPTSDFRLAGIDYDTRRYYMEYVVGQMDGLAERVDARGNRELEKVTVDGKIYSVTSIEEIRDGDTIRAILIPERDQPVITRP